MLFFSHEKKGNLNEVGNKPGWSLFRSGILWSRWTMVDMDRPLNHDEN